MQLNRSRHLIVLGVAVPALLAGGLMAAGASSAAPSTPAAATINTATAASTAAARRLPRICSGRGANVHAWTNIRGRKGKLIGRVHIYLSGLPGDNRAFCLVTKRLGKARAKAALTRVSFKEHCPPPRVFSAEAISRKRSKYLHNSTSCSFSWWGGMRYKGIWHNSRRTFESSVRVGDA